LGKWAIPFRNLTSNLGAAFDWISFEH